ncbi:hypothetical protein [Emticicia soli]|uniref:Uncharacterized protein n=1 Tax=Emticicia soli TaxID=2027878 RepID=A0ABW5J7P1_9BACT
MDRIRTWIENNGVKCYEIHSVASKEKVAERDCNDTHEAIAEFEKDYAVLSDGKYFIKGMKGPKSDRGAVRIDFQIGINNTTNYLGGMTLEQIKAEAYNQARKDFEYEQLDKRLTELERKFKVIVTVLVDLTDGDESNDEKATNVLEMISNAKENFEGAKDILKDFKI